MENNTFEININSSSTIYSQLAEFIVSEIHADKIKIGNRLLSVNEACRTYNVSRDTVLAAYKQLQEQNIITSIPGKGFYVMSKKSADTVRVYVLFDAMNQYKDRKSTRLNSSH